MMRAWAKYAAILLITVFTVAASFQVSQATMMDIQMSSSVGSQSLDESCGGCPTGSSETDTPCPVDCVTSAAAILTAEAASLAGLSNTNWILAPRPDLIGWRAPPDPFPPKPAS